MNRKIIVCLLVLIGICAISHVSAVDDNSTAIASDDASEIEASVNEDNVVANSTGNEVVSNESAPVTPSKGEIKVSKLTTPYKSGTWSISLVDSATSKGISNAKVSLKIYTGSNYKLVNVNTNSKGIATYKTSGLAVGTHKVVLSGLADGYSINPVTSSVKVIKQTALKFKVYKRTFKDGASLSIQVLNKKTKKGLNGVKIKLLIYTGSKLTKTVVLNTKKFRKTKGAAGFATNDLKVGKHKVVIKPYSIKYKGSKKTSMTIKKSAKKYSIYSSHL